MIRNDRTNSNAKANELDALCQRFGEYVGHVSGVEAPSNASLPIEHRIASYVLQPDLDVVAALHRTAKDIVRSPFDTPGMVDMIDEGVQRLMYLVPPDPILGEGGIPLESHDMVAYVFMVAWLFKLNGIKQWESRYGWSDRKCDEVLSGICLKALESSDLVARFNEER
jgi:hypothetical protein